MSEPTTETVPFLGADFHLAEKVGLMPLMRFAVLARSGVDADDMDGLAATYDLLEQCIHPGDWERFAQHATKERADGDQLMEVVGAAMTAMAKRPTGRSSASSDGPPTTGPSSTDDSSSVGNVIAMFNEQGRPDLALLVRRRQESLTG